MFAPAVRRPGSAFFGGTRAWIVLSLVGLLAWGLLATAATGPGRGDPGTAVPANPFRLTAGHASTKDTTFKVASFNVLGYNHTTRGGDAKGFASGIKRMEYARGIIKRRHASVVGFQELQPEQFDKFNRLTGKRWALYPGDSLERIAMHNSIAWRTRVWERVDASYIPIPYFHGAPVKMPIVKLRNKQTGRVVYFANFHNPADTFGPAQKWRNKARAMQIALARRKAAEGAPLVITGDMNEREEYFCAMVGHAPMHAAQGGRHSARKPCETPSPMGIDWIFGSRSIEFLSYRKVETERVHMTSDHPFVVTRAVIPGR